MAAERRLLLPFEFFPHLNANAGDLARLVTSSRHFERPILAVHDGDGVVVADGLVECIGNPVWISRGAVTQASAIEPAGMKVSPGS